MISEYIHFDFDFYYKAGWHDSIPELTEKQQECIRDTIARLDTMCHLCKCQYYPWRPDMLPYPPEIKYRNRSCQHGTLLNEFMSRMVTLAKEREYVIIGELRVDSTEPYTIEQLPIRMHNKLEDMVGRMNRVCYISDYYTERFRDRGSFYCDGGTYLVYNNVKQLVWTPNDLLAKRACCFTIHGSNAPCDKRPFGENNFAPGVPVYSGGLCKSCRDYIEDHWKILAGMFSEYNTERSMYLSTQRLDHGDERLEPIHLDTVDTGLETQCRGTDVSLNSRPPGVGLELSVNGINKQPLIWYSGLPRHIQRFILDACGILNGNCTISSDSYYQRGAAMDTDCDEVAWTPEAIMQNREYCGVACYQPSDEYMCRSCDAGVDYVWGYITRLMHEYNLIVSDLSPDNTKVNSELLRKYNELLARGYLAELDNKQSNSK